MEIYCFTYKSNIRPESIVENELEKLLNENLTDLSLKRFEKHMKEFNYREGILIPDYEQLSSFMVHENAIEDPSPLDRVRLIFEEDNLIAIVHSRNMEINGIQTFPIERGRNLSILKNFDSIEQEKFIEKNKKAYYGID